LASALTGKFTFELQPYLEAIDAAAADQRLPERGRRLARRVELALARHAEKFDAPLGREVTVPMAWQTGNGQVNLRHQGRLHAIPLADLPEDDRAAWNALLLMALNPFRLPAPLD
jgi:hypothetical protein